MYLISVLSIVPQMIGQRLSFIDKYNKMIESAGDYKGGIIDKTKMCEAIWQMGWHANLIWVK